MQALVCIAKLIKGFPPHQGKLGSACVTAANGGSIPALQAILQVTSSKSSGSCIYLSAARVHTVATKPVLQIDFQCYTVWHW